VERTDRKDRAQTAERAVVFEEVILEKGGRTKRREELCS